MFKLPGKPSPKASIYELADFMELLCWVRETVSRQDVIRFLGMIDDNLDQDGETYEGCEDAEDRNGDRVDEMLNEIDRRQQAVPNYYPFQLDDTGTILTVNNEKKVHGCSLLYFYLLAATRLNMKKDRVQGEIDGTLEMENISAHVMKKYLGSGRSKAMVFGTSSSGSFEERVNRLCKSVKEPTSFENVDGGNVSVAAQDGKLDVVAWIPFSDSLPGQLIMFAQVKTGTSWRDRTCELSPEIFQRKWLRKPFLVPPIRAFCVAEVVDRTGWSGTCSETGILFDRCRIVDCCERLTPELETRIRTWAYAAKQTITEYLRG